MHNPAHIAGAGHAGRKEPMKHAIALTALVLTVGAITMSGVGGFSAGNL